ncbi:MAG: ribulose-phosphate 3-epimerase [Candidatus Parcubacteria bacterium]|nr:MAG: ribulose-phosphate 3-epimerase [Candidatus Parcubacteria bacterium]
MNMKIKIIPAINAQSFEEIKEKLDLLKDLVDHFHLDVASLEFTGYQTWQNPEDLDKIQNYEELTQNLLKNKITFDLHLMISLKPQEILKWNKENVKTFILHLEASPNPDSLLKMAKKTKKKIFIAWSPTVEFEFIEKYLNYIDGVLILGVNPGRAGQEFLEETYNRINQLQSLLASQRKLNKIKLMIDGGVNEENFKKILSYKPDFIVMASAIYNSPNPKETYLKFKNMV